jgi:hypothetical protein
MPRILERAIGDLPEAFRTVLVARLVEGMSVEDAAKLLDIRPETVKTRLFRARALLSSALEQRPGAALQDSGPLASAASALRIMSSRHCGIDADRGNLFSERGSNAGNSARGGVNAWPFPNRGNIVLALAAGTAAAQSAKPNDAQIAYMAYTAGEIDIKAAA